MGVTPPVTSPTSVGQVSVEVLADVRTLAKSLKSEVESAFRGLRLDRAIQQAVGDTTVRMRVDPEVDTARIEQQVRGTNAPRIPVQLDPDFNSMRSRLAGFFNTLRQTVRVDVDVDKGGRSGGIGSLFKGLSDALPKIGGVTSGLADISGAMQKVAGSSAQMGGSLVGAFTTATGPVGIVIGLLVAAAGAAAALGAAIVGGVAIGIPAVTALAGAIAAIPAALAGAGAAVGTLALGFKGIGAALGDQPRGGGGGGGGNPAGRARQIAAAERGIEAARRGIAAATRGVEQAERNYDAAVRRVAEAQDRARKAQQAINQARREAVEDLDDLNRALAGARLSEEEAALGVTDALRELNEARLTGNLPDIQRAELAYRRAQLTLEDAKDSTGDLAAEQADAAAKGVEGSDKVQAALADQSDALQAVKDAQVGVLDAQNGVLAANDGLKASYEGLASAQDSLAAAQEKVAAGGGGVAREMVKLAPAAQKFVDAIKALKPAFEALRLDVQQRLFAGLDQTVTNLGNAWIPALRTTLGNYADTFNRFFKNLGTSLGQPKFIADIQAGAEGARQGLSKIGDSISTSLVPAFGALSRAAGPFLTKLGEEIAGVVTEFSKWVLQGEKTGGLKDFFDRASEALHDIFTTGKLVTKIVGQIIGIITGVSDKTGTKSPIDSFNESLQRVSDWLKDPENQQKVKDFIEDVKDAVIKLIDFGKKVKGFIDDVQDAWDKLVDLKDKVVEFKNDIKEFLGLGDDDGQAKEGGKSTGRSFIDGLWEGIKEKLSGFSIAGLLWEGPGSLLGQIKAGLGIASPSTVMMAVGVDFIQGLIDGIGGAVGGLLARAAALPGQILSALGNLATPMITRGRQAVTGLMNGISSMFTSLRTRATQLRTTIGNALASAGTWLVNNGKNVVGGLMNGIASWLGNLSNRARGLRTTVLNALSNAGTWLVNTGRNLVIGLGNGISSLGNWLWDKAVALAESVKNAAMRALGIASPSKVMAEIGRQVPAGLAVGIEGRTRLVEDAAARMAQAAIPSLGSADLGAGFDAQIQRSLQVASSQQLVAQWAPGQTGDPILDGLRNAIQFRFRGDPLAALGTG